MVWGGGGGGGVMSTLCQSEGTQQIVTSFSPPAVSCLLKKGLQNGATPLHFNVKILQTVPYKGKESLFAFDRCEQNN